MKVDFSAADPGASLTGFLGATALGILAFKGFTTITNSGSELKAPHRNLGNAIMISTALCVVIYARWALRSPATCRWVKTASDPLVLIVAAAVMAAILITEFVFLRTRPSRNDVEKQVTNDLCQQDRAD